MTWESALVRAVMAAGFGVIWRRLGHILGNVSSHRAPLSATAVARSADESFNASSVDAALQSVGGEGRMVTRRMGFDGRRRAAAVRLSESYWAALDEICLAEGLGPDTLARRIDESRPRTMSFAKALRVFLLNYYRARAGAGHLPDPTEIGGGGGLAMAPSGIDGGIGVGRTADVPQAQTDDPD